MLFGSIGELRDPGDVVTELMATVSKEFSEVSELTRDVYMLIRTIEELKEQGEIIQRRVGSATQFRGEFEQRSAPVCELKESSMLELRREVEALRRPVCELKESSTPMTTTQGVHRYVAAVSVLKEFSELLELRGNVRPSSGNVDELKCQR